jgi:4'-phosphopantetheinyl transferase
VSPNTFTIPENIRNSLHAAGLSLLSSTTPEAASWWCELKRPAGEIERCMEWLAPDERARVDRLGTNLLRERYIAGRAMLRLLLGHILGVEPANVPLQRGARGRPQIRGPHSIDFNVSHTDDVALIGIAHTTQECLRIGVDVERADRNVNADRLARKCLTSKEANAQTRLTPTSVANTFCVIGRARKP